MQEKKWITVGIFAPLALLFCPVFCAARSTPYTADREIKITARRFAFEPDKISSHKDERVKLIVTSEDVDHGFAIEEFGIDERIKAKQTKVIELTPDKAGTFQFSCSVACGDGHSDMVGELVVTNAESESSPHIRLKN